MSQITNLFGPGGGGGAIVQTLTGNSGGAVPPTAGNINVVGGNNINIVGNPGTSTLTASVSGTTNHSLQLGNAGGSLNQLGVATNGQIPIGSAGADPVLATLTPGNGITITNGAGSITISASGQAFYAYTNVNTTPYVVLLTDEFLSVDCSGGPITVQLPNTPTTGQSWIIKDRTGNAQINNITVTTVGGVKTIDGVTSYVMNTKLSSIEVIYNGTNYEIF